MVMVAEGLHDGLCDWVSKLTSGRHLVTWAGDLVCGGFRVSLESSSSDRSTSH